MDGFLEGWIIVIYGMNKMVLFATEMLSVGKEVQDSTSAGLSQKAFFWFVVAEEYFASHDDGFSSSFR